MQVNKVDLERDTLVQGEMPLFYISFSRVMNGSRLSKKYFIENEKLNYEELSFERYFNLNDLYFEVSEIYEPGMYICQAQSLENNAKCTLVPCTKIENGNLNSKNLLPKDNFNYFLGLVEERGCLSVISTKEFFNDTQ